MTYTETLDYLFNSLPMYHRIGQAAYKADITHTLQMMEHLGNPERKFRSIHVAGTNGKGSVSHTLASILMQAGYKVGLYTSPHLVDFRERIRTNGEMIAKESVVDFVSQHRAFMQSLDLSFFEMTVGMAFDHFAREQVDVAVVEVGMGGRLDSTNVITPDLSIITNIGLDHTQFLGNTLQQIAGEKAGIIKPDVPVVVGETHPDTRPVFEAKAREMDAPIYFADKHFQIQEETHEPSLHDTDLHFRVLCDHDNPLALPAIAYSSPLSGQYQLHNLATLFQALSVLSRNGYSFTPHHVVKGLQRTIIDTGLHGRWERVADNPVTICETAHNADGIRSMLQKLSLLPYRQLHLIYGCVNDKDYRSILQMLPRERTTHYYSQPSVPRRLPVEQLVATAAELDLQGKAYPDVHEAIASARSAADPEHDLVLVTGSIFLVADAFSKK